MSGPEEHLRPCRPHPGQLGRRGNSGLAGGSDQHQLQWQRGWDPSSLGSNVLWSKPVAPVLSWKRQRIKHWPPNWPEWTLLRFLYIKVMEIQPVSKPKPNQHQTPRNLNRTPLPTSPRPGPGSPTGFSRACRMDVCLPCQLTFCSSPSRSLWRFSLVPPSFWELLPPPFPWPPCRWPCSCDLWPLSTGSGMGLGLKRDQFRFPPGSSPPLPQLARPAVTAWPK